MLSKQVKNAIQGKVATKKLKVISEDMKSTFQKFVKVDEEYNTMLEKDATMGEKYSVVNELNTDQYTEYVANIHEEANFLYEKCKKEEEEKRTERKIMAGGKMMRRKLGVIESHEDIEDVNELLQFKSKIDDIVEEAQEVILAMEEIPGIDWTNPQETMDGILTESIKVQMKIGAKLMGRGSGSNTHHISSQISVSSNGSSKVEESRGTEEHTFEGGPAVPVSSSAHSVSSAAPGSLLFQNVLSSSSGGSYSPALMSTGVAPSIYSPCNPQHASALHPPLITSTHPSASALHLPLCALSLTPI